MSQSIKSRTKSGTEVEITPTVNTIGEPEVRLTFTHPARGSLRVNTSYFGTFGRGPEIGAVGNAYAVDARKVIGSCCVQVPREDFERGMVLARELAEVEASAARERKAADAAAAREACPEGFVPCRQKWSNGDLCSACYVAEDGTETLASDLLESHGGWYWIPAADVGTARTEAQTQQAAKTARTQESARKLTEAKARAAETGQPVEIGRWMDECDGSAGDECSTDLCVKLVLPDGTTKVERTHTY